MHRSMNQDADKDSFLNNMLVIKQYHLYISYFSSVKLIRTLEQIQTFSLIYNVSQRSHDIVSSRDEF